MRFVCVMALTLPALSADGEALFRKNCSIGYCHGTAGAAARGPRLRDREFDGAHVYKVTRDGIPKSAMPGWKDKLSDEEIRSIVVYVMSLSNKQANLPPASGEAKAAEPAAFIEHCGSCHRAGEHGTAIGPSLAGYDGARIRKAVSQPATRVRQVVLVDETFPGVVVAEADGLVQVYDLTEPPPVKRTLERKEIRKTDPVPQWTHPDVEKVLEPVSLFLRSIR